MHKESYIDKSINDPSEIPSYVQDSLNCLIQYDKEGRWWMYDAELDNLWVLAKNAIADGNMSKATWKIIYKKYWEHEDKIREGERTNENI